ncbi:glycosyltransferase [Asticcacaulis sp. DW145]|uniref:glycosyltransferase family 2 protein n=1 Tax=Asticcacaulis sp. DW145 TaxID=3095608 RepID=UPI00308D3EBC|nr:glycosyltransferase [Asticcacaulis sp. DW145]
MKISVIVCTKDRAQLIGLCLDAIFLAFRAAELTEGSEIVVVDNASTDETANEIRSWGDKNECNIQYVFAAKTGLSAARNAGIERASGDIIAFIDDDCRVHSGYFLDLLAHFQKDGGELVLRSGSVLLGDENDLPLTVKPVATSRRWKRPASRADEGDLMGKSLIGCNMVGPKAVFERVGPFDERLGAGSVCKAGEDTDYFYRAYLAGVSLETVPNMHLFHFHGRRTFEDGRKLLESYAVGNGAVSVKYTFKYFPFFKHLYWSFKRFISHLLRKNTAHYITPSKEFFLILKGAFLYLFYRKA